MYGYENGKTTKYYNNKGMKMEKLFLHLLFLCIFIMEIYLWYVLNNGMLNYHSYVGLL